MKYHAYSFNPKSPRHDLRHAAQLFIQRYGCRPAGIFIHKDEMHQFTGLGLEPLKHMPRKAFYFQINNKEQP